MTGTTFQNFTGWTVTNGKWDDVTGELGATFSDGAQQFTIASVMGQGFHFDAGGIMNDSPATSPDGLAQFSLSNVQNMDARVANTSSENNGKMTFLDGVQCCGGTPGLDPNTFALDPSDADIGTMVLWGASNFNEMGTATDPLDNFWDDLTTGNPFSFSRLGIDLRLRLTKSDGPDNMNPVPVPAALPLFAGGLGIMGFLGWRRRSRGTTA